MPADIFLEGHGTYEARDGNFIVPENVEIVFTVEHGQEQLDIVSSYAVAEIFQAGQQCRNYRLWPLYGGAQFSQPTARCFRFMEDAVEKFPCTVYVDIHGWGVELSVLSYILQSAAPSDGSKLTLRWLACREVIVPNNPKCITTNVGISHAEFLNRPINQIDWPESRSGQVMPLINPGQAQERLRSYMEIKAVI